MPYYDNLYCKYTIVHGQDWQLTSGITDGITQQSRRQQFSACSHQKQPVNVFNHPLQVSFSSTNPYGWPQIAVAVYGPDMLGRDVIKGYGVAHLPRQPGHHDLYLPLFAPSASSIANEIFGVMQGRSPEYVDLKFLTKPSGREVARTKSHGAVKLSLDVILKDIDACGFTTL